MTRYAMGFCFSWNNHVLLIKKQKDSMHEGLYNGIGGKIEEGESADHAMEREWAEESHYPPVGWREYMRMRFDNENELVLFAAQIDKGVKRGKFNAAECTWFSGEELFKVAACNFAPHTKWFVEAAREAHNTDWESFGIEAGN